MFSNIIRICIIIFFLFFGELLSSSYALGLDSKISTGNERQSDKPAGSFLTCADSVKILFHVSGLDTSTQMGTGLSCLGDINNDGYDDIAICAAGTDSTYIYYGSDSFDIIPDLTIKGRGGPVSAIDLDADDKIDLVNSVINYSIYSFGKVYFYHGYGDSIGSQPYDSLIPAEDNNGFGEVISFAYVDSDSLPDMLTYNRETPDTIGPSLFYFSGCPALDKDPEWQYDLKNNLHQFFQIGFVDFNGDGHPDIFAGLTPDFDTSGYVYILFGPDFSAAPSIVLAPPEGLDSLGGPLGKKAFAYGVHNIGDYNGDGFEDLCVFYNGTPLIYFCGPNADSNYDLMMYPYAVDIAALGDVNGDSYDDFVAGYTTSFCGEINIFLGGRKCDNLPDFCLNEYGLPPIGVYDIGYRVKGAGDINHDGLNDIMFSTGSLVGHSGEVFIISGSKDIATDAPEYSVEVSTEDFRLNQNYPNPFNLETTIEFDVNRRDTVSLAIYNCKGQKVMTLIDRKCFSAGKHKIIWDGRLHGGVLASSGVYFYRLRVGDYSHSKKMLLLK